MEPFPFIKPHAYALTFQTPKDRPPDRAGVRMDGHTLTRLHALIRDVTPQRQSAGFRPCNATEAVDTLFDWIERHLGHPFARTWEHAGMDDCPGYPSFKKLRIHFVCIPRMLGPFVTASSSHYVNATVRDPERARLA